MNQKELVEDEIDGEETVVLMEDRVGRRGQDKPDQKATTYRGPSLYVWFSYANERRGTYM